MTTQAPLDLAQVRARLNAATGKEYWRSLEEVANAEGFRELMEREFPRFAGYWPDGVSRRAFLKIMAASLALAGLAGCSPPGEQIKPYVRQPEQITPGKPLFYATALTLNGFARGVLAESNMGRPTKIEGNPDHPASLGATDIFAQAAILTLYDPDRSQAVTNAGRITTWERFGRDFRQAIETQRGKQGAGVRILTQTVTSPTLASQLQRILRDFPQARWYQYEPVNRDNAYGGARLAFGQPVEAQYNLDRADVILSLEADLIGAGPGQLRYARQFSRRRNPGGPGGMNRLYVVESHPTVTGANADNRLPLRSVDVEPFARAVAAGVGVQAGAVTPPAAAPAEWVRAVVDDLNAHRGRSLIVAGDRQPPIVHALAHAMNQSLGNVGQTVTYTDPAVVNPVDQGQSLQELVADMDAGRVELLVILGGNPAYDTPADLQFAQRLSAMGENAGPGQPARVRVHLALYEDETSQLCQWHVPLAHELESWSDARSVDGAVTIIQPLISPLYNGRTAHEVLAMFYEPTDKAPYDILREFWQTQSLGANFDTAWNRALHDGVLANTALAPRTVTLQNLASQPATPAAPADALEIVFAADPTLYDGRFANNGWLQELPKPITMLTWDNVAMVGPATAEKLGLATGNIVAIDYKGGRLEAPVMVVPGVATNTVALTLGHGRRKAGRVGTGVGFDAYALRSVAAPWFDSGVQITKTGGDYKLATTQMQHSLEGRDMIRSATFEEYQKEPSFARGSHNAEAPGRGQGSEGEPLSMYTPWEYKGNAWGMTVDTTLCIGCHACTIACQAENNIPIVGKENVWRGRAMHWLKVDHYYLGGADNPDSYFQPRPCMHCENAPCEPVCPVAATVHSHDGLNDMVYNRCVGTRYCSNNCPYKVRRFNYLQYTDYQADPVLRMVNNPDVTVRTRGVMEKCTFCVQRIRQAEIEAKKDGRPIRDGEVLTACQAVCPTNAITFGNINDENSAVRKQKEDPRNYAMLEELNTRPRTTYLAAVRNPNPALPKPGESHS